MTTQLICRDKILDLSIPQVMGILNVTPDSFSDGGKFKHIDQALQQAEQMIHDGAAIIDIGGESTRPGADDVAEHEELHRVVPLIEAITQRFDTIVSIDTSKALVMSESVSAGAHLINDVRALQNEGCLDVAANANVPICLMHMQGLPRTMQNNPDYENVIQDVINFFKARINACCNAGIDKSNLLLDPGFGFGKSLKQNYTLLTELTEFHRLELPVLVGMSRKSMIGNLLNRDVTERLAGSLSAAIIAAQKGASIIRVHDVKETVDALAVLKAAS